MPAAGAQPAAVPPSDYWQAEGYYATPHNPHGWTWHPGPSYPQVVVPYLGPWGTYLWPDWDGVPPSPRYSLLPADHEPEEAVEPALDGNRQSGSAGIFYGGGSTGIGLAAPPHRAGDGNLADMFTRPLPPQAVFYNNPSYCTMDWSSTQTLTLTTVQP
ncbi:hypothetical protein CYMTET_13406 [Cymbomonas tetramitiformis]|uniref:Uncharacterized protein n=1 Tax=Cymbomonas tetramitiformis TaxID=36881 RepID=A0AAE0GJQ4_9CHLO|nr:hypothetical protein CYMTET_13406 [Cymbomonas tetramitiformis]